MIFNPGLDIDENVLFLLKHDFDAPKDPDSGSVLEKPDLKVPSKY
jgi:hypothetical protein